MLRAVRGFNTIEVNQPTKHTHQLVQERKSFKQFCAEMKEQPAEDIKAMAYTVIDLCLNKSAVLNQRNHFFAHLKKQNDFIDEVTFEKYCKVFDVALAYRRDFQDEPRLCDLNKNGLYKVSSADQNETNAIILALNRLQKCR